MSQYLFSAVYMTQVSLQDSVNSHTISSSTFILLYNIWCERLASGIFGATTQLYVQHDYATTTVEFNSSNKLKNLKKNLQRPVCSSQEILTPIIPSILSPYQYTKILAHLHGSCMHIFRDAYQCKVYQKH